FQPPTGLPVRLVRAATVRRLFDPLTIHCEPQQPLVSLYLDSAGRLRFAPLRTETFAPSRLVRTGKVKDKPLSSVMPPRGRLASWVIGMVPPVRRVKYVRLARTSEGELIWPELSASKVNRPLETGTVSSNGSRSRLLLPTARNFSAPPVI